MPGGTKSDTIFNNVSIMPGELQALFKTFVSIYVGVFPFSMTV